uniref:single-strand DNA endonuclease ASTE1 isoform X1 n=2 Tax=Myxine glutinosa TaxID=7769 RepID=UPI00358F0B4E
MTSDFICRSFDILNLISRLCFLGGVDLGDCGVMGIRGLTRYIRSHSEFFQDVSLCNCKLLIDGDNLYHNLYFSSGLDIAHGGDYARFADIVREFFAALRVCRVAPFVVFDGICDKDNKKLATLKQRTQERIIQAQSLSFGGSGSILPIVADEVFIQTIMSLRVPMAQAEVEADSELAALAKQWGCPVLTQDSDFFIFNIPGGVCAFSDLPWHTLSVKASSGQRYITTKLFFQCHLYCQFSLKTPRLLAILAVVLGNDYVDSMVMQPFMSAITQTVKRGPVARPLQIEILFRWLSRFNDERDALHAAMKYVDVSRCKVQEQKLLDIVQEYISPESTLDSFFSTGYFPLRKGYFVSAQAKGACPPCHDRRQPLNPGAKCSEIPEWIGEGLKAGLLPPFVCEAFKLRQIILSTQVECVHLQSSHLCSRNIRYAIYSLLLGGPATSLRPKSRHHRSSGKWCLVEIDRRGKGLLHTQVRPEDSALFAQDIPELHRLPEIQVDSRYHLLLTIMGCSAEDLADVPTDLQLPIAATRHWLIHAVAPKPRPLHLHALLLGFVYGKLTASISAGPVSQAEAPGTGRDLKICIVKALMNLAKSKVLARPQEVTSHVCNQWFSCLVMASHLNKILGYPLQDPPLERLYCGPLVHGLSRALSSPSVSPESLLASSSGTLALYLALQQATTKGPTASVAKVGSKKKKRKSKTRAARNDVKDELDAECGWVSALVLK